MNLAATSLTAAAAPILAGALLDRFAGSEDLAYRAGFALKSSAVLAGFLILRAFRAPLPSNTTHAPGAFRMLRQLLSIQGLVFLANLSPQRQIKVPPTTPGKKKT